MTAMTAMTERRRPTVVLCSMAMLVVATDPVAARESDERPRILRGQALINRFFPTWYIESAVAALFGLAHTDDNFGTLIEQGEDITRLSGIGKNLAAKIHEILETGHCQSLDKLRKKLPADLTELLKLPGLGPKRVLFGTDSPMRDPRPQLGWAVHANISRKDKVALLGGNCRRILNQCKVR